MTDKNKNGDPNKNPYVSSEEVAIYGSHPKNIPDTSSKAYKIYNEEIKGENGKEYTGYTLNYISVKTKIDKNGEYEEKGINNGLHVGDILSTQKLITDVNFKFNEFDKNSIVNIEKIDKAAEEINKLLRENPPVKIKIEGNTDAVGNKDYNQKLSEKRAVTISQLLMEKIDPDLRNRVYVSKTGNGEEKLTEQTQDKSLTNRNVSIVAESTSNESYYRVVVLDSKAQKHFCGEYLDEKSNKKFDSTFQLEFLSGKKAGNTFLNAKSKDVSLDWKEPSGAIVLDDIKNNTSPAHINVKINDPKNFALLVGADDQNKVSMKHISGTEIAVSYNGKVVADVKYDLQNKDKHLDSRNIKIGVITAEGEIKIKNQKDLAMSEQDKNMDNAVRDALKKVNLSGFMASADHANEPKTQLVTGYNVNVQQNPNQLG